MTWQDLTDFIQDNWRSAIEIGILWVVIYYAYLYFRGTRGAKALTSFGVVFLTLILVSQLLQLVVIAWLIRNDRILAAACIFPVSQREDLDRNLGLRHRAALGLSEESDAVTIVVSEETGIVSLCHRGKIERNFNPESFKQRLGELLLQET